MSYPLWSRCHYGHPDLLDKLDQISQGGISKGDKSLNLSEDIFAGMDALLRGRHIAYKDYIQVGKGRDMGVDSILGFFSKLSSGTAKMTTTRQAFRIGVRSSFGRLLGFYYAHIGYYAGQLHFFHASYMPLALAFLGAVADGCDVLDNSASASGELMKMMLGPFSLLFVFGTLVPLVFVLLKENGAYAAVAGPLRQLSRLSPLFFAVQSKVIGDSFSRELAQGGGGYVATGRGLGIWHLEFHVLYIFLAESCYYPAVDLLLMLVLWPLAHAYAVGPFALFFAYLLPFALLAGPSLFNPGCFNQSHGASRDLAAWWSWLSAEPAPGTKRDPKKSWSEWWYTRQAARAGAHTCSFLLPSKELMLGLLLLLISVKVLQPHGWYALVYLLIPLPLTALVAMLLLALALEILSKLPTLTKPKVLLALSSACLLLLCGELFVLVASTPGLSASSMVAILSATFFSRRAAMNTLGYLPLERMLGRVSIPTLKKMAKVVVAAVNVTTMAHALMVDVMLGLVIQLVLLSLSYAPYLNTAHEKWLGVRSTPLENAGAYLQNELRVSRFSSDRTDEQTI